MANIDVKKEIANRLNWELNKRGYSSQDIAALCGIPEQKINSYLLGSENLNLKEIQQICSSMNVNVYRLISKNYFKTNLLFRNVNRKIKDKASEIEDIFLIIEDYLEKSNTTKSRSLNLLSHKRDDIIASVSSAANKFIENYSSDVNEFIDKLNINIIPLSYSNIDSNFDAFVLMGKKNVGICINQNNHPSRIIFSILHELSHILFDRNNQVEVDTDIYKSAALFSRYIDNNIIHEFIANKFAQYILIPFELAEVLKYKLDKENLQYIQEKIYERGTSKDVITHAIYDYERVKSGESVSFNNIRDKLQTLQSSNNKQIFHLLYDRKKKIQENIKSHKNNFSEKVYDRIVNGLQLWN